MADIFVRSDAFKLLAWKHILIIGDSNMRALYKDLVCLLTCGKLLTLKELRSKGEISFLGDTRGKCSSLNRTRDFVEDRYKLCKDEDSGVCVKVEFIFTTKVYNQNIVDRFTSQKKDLPDVVLINSIIWDLTRWGPNGDILFKANLNKLVKLFKHNLPPSTTVVWLTAQHLSSRETTTALVVKELDFLKTFLQHHVVEANTYAAIIMQQHGYNVLDAHYYSRLLNYRRRPDGVHYNCTAVRFQTNLILTHLALQHNMKLPGRHKSWEIDHVLASQQAILDECDGLQQLEDKLSSGKSQALDVNGQEAVGTTFDITDENKHITTKPYTTASLIDFDQIGMGNTLDTKKTLSINSDNGQDVTTKTDNIGTILSITGGNGHTTIRKTLGVTDSYVKEAKKIKLDTCDSNEKNAKEKTLDIICNEGKYNEESTVDIISSTNEESTKSSLDIGGNIYASITKRAITEQKLHLTDDSENITMKKTLDFIDINGNNARETALDITDINGNKATEKTFDINDCNEKCVITPVNIKNEIGHGYIEKTKATGKTLDITDGNVQVVTVNKLDKTDDIVENAIRTTLDNIKQYIVEMTSGINEGNINETLRKNLDTNDGNEHDTQINAINKTLHIITDDNKQTPNITVDFQRDAVEKTLTINDDTGKNTIGTIPDMNNRNVQEEKNKDSENGTGHEGTTIDMGDIIGQDPKNQIFDEINCNDQEATLNISDGNREGVLKTTTNINKSNGNATEKILDEKKAVKLKDANQDPDNRAEKVDGKKVLDIKQTIHGRKRTFVDNEKTPEENGKVLDSKRNTINHGKKKESPRKILHAKRRLQTMDALNTRADAVLTNTVDDLMKEIDWQMESYELGWFSVFGPDY